MSSPARPHGYPRQTRHLPPRRPSLHPTAPPPPGYSRKHPRLVWNLQHAGGNPTPCSGNQRNPPAFPLNLLIPLFPLFLPYGSLRRKHLRSLPPPTREEAAKGSDRES